MPAITRRQIILVPGATALASLSGCTIFSGFESSTADARDKTSEALPMVNALRETKGLSALSYDTAAARAAADQAVRMANHNEMAHNIGFGADFAKRMKGMDVQLPAAENIAMGQDTVERAITAWINSHKHLVNMLGDYRGLGVAVAQEPASGNKPFWSMVLSG